MSKSLAAVNRYARLIFLQYYGITEMSKNSDIINSGIVPRSIKRQRGLYGEEKSYR